MDPKIIEELARKLAANVPGSVRALQADLERNFRALLQASFDKLDLVTREEFDVQRRVLERTRERLTRLEAELARLEGAARVDGGGGSRGEPTGDSSRDAAKDAADDAAKGSGTDTGSNLGPGSLDGPS